MKDQMSDQLQQVGRYTAAVCFGALLLCVSGAAQAASLGKIEVASPLAKPLYAEVPLNLKANELASKVFIEIASAADYKIFEVYRDPVLDNIRADVASDERGARVKLTSRIAMQSPFFNLVLKIRYGRVSHFKKYSVFLDSAKSIQRVADQIAVPHVEAVVPLATNASAAKPTPARIESAGKALISQQDMLRAKDKQQTQQSQQEVYLGWARTEKYGPIVRGDSLSVVARRLRIDQRYSTSQIMVALFEKNKKSFNQNNLNLIKANSFLKVPSAEEVEQHSKSEAYRISLEHRQAWKNEPRYAVEAEVQRTRYSPRVSVGEQADGHIGGQALTNNQAKDTTATAQTASATQDLLKPEQAPATAASLETPVPAALGSNSARQTVSLGLETMLQAQAETNQLLAALQQKNEQLQQQLIANKDSVDALNAKVDEGAAAASNARVEKLELLLTRLQAELEKQALKPISAKAEALDWVTWLLLSLLIIMLAVIAMLMRKEPVHPSSAEQTAKFDRESEHPALTEPGSAVHHLEEAVEKEVDAIETDEQEVSLAKATGTFDAMSAFTDELSDTDTAELEPFDVDAKQELDANVDYVSEADVYIRYGMDEEALQQLDMALRLNPEHAEAHIKKSEILHAKQDKQAYAAALAAATVALGTAALAQYKAAVEAFGGDADASSEEPELPMVEGIDTLTPLTMAIDDAEIDALDFDLTGLNASLEKQVVDAGEDAAADVAVDVEIETIDQSSDLMGAEELDWLSDPAFDTQPADGQSDGEIDESGLLTTSAATQQLDSLLGEFADADHSMEEAPGSEAQNEVKDDLHGLLSEFTEQDGVGDDLAHLDAVTSDTFEAGATQHLDSLLNEFSDADDLSFADTKDDFEPASIEPGQASAELEADDVVSTTLDANYGATQELDSLLAEFSDDDDSLSFLEPEAATTEGVTMAQPKAMTETTEMGLDHGATQELSSLLGEFSADDSEADDKHIDPGATQVLGRLLDEFSDDDDEEGDTKKS